MSRMQNTRNRREKLQQHDMYVLPSVTILTAVCLAVSLVSIFTGKGEGFLPLFAVPAILLAFSYPRESIFYSAAVGFIFAILKFALGGFADQPAAACLREVLAPAGLFVLLSVLTAVGALPRTLYIQLLQEEISQLGTALAETSENLAELKQHHKRTEDALDESGKRLQALLEQVTYPVVKLNPELYITAVNSHFLHFTGKDEADLVGRNIAALPEFHSRISERHEGSFVLPSRVDGVTRNLVWRISEIKPDIDRSMQYILITGVDLPSE